MLANAVDPCRPKLKEHMEYCMSHPEEVSKISSVQKQVSVSI